MLAVVRLERADVEHLVPVAVDHVLALLVGDHGRARDDGHCDAPAMMMSRSPRSGRRATAAKAVERRGGREEGGRGDRAHVQRRL